MYKEFVKPISDFIVALVIGMILLIPLLLVAVLIKFDSRGPVFFKQKRIGYNGNIFDIYKFRSMIQGAEQLGPYYTNINDSRVTRIGALLRKTSIDELPQVLNILLGNMSLIGPRPDVPLQRELYTEQEFQERHLVKPGITGLAQSRNRHSATTRMRKRYDLFYVKKMTFCLDIKIVFWTLKTIFRGSY